MGSPHNMFSIIHLFLFLTIWNTSKAVNLTVTEGEFDARSPCFQGWFDFSSSGMGCLQFYHGNSYTWAEASVYCHGQGANLVEISSFPQLDFVRAFMYALDDIGGSKTGWTAGSDFGVEGQWRWIVTSQPVGSFIWHTGQPDDAEKAQCLALYYAGGYMGYDYDCSTKLYPICQK